MNDDVFHSYAPFKADSIMFLLLQLNFITTIQDANLAIADSSSLLP